MHEPHRADIVDVYFNFKHDHERLAVEFHGEDGRREEQLANH